MQLPTTAVQIARATPLLPLAGGGAAAAPATPDPAVPTDTMSRIKQAVAEGQDDWSHEGGKLAVLAAASAGTILIPFGVALAFPSLANVALSYPGFLGTLAGISIEEDKIGIARKLGGAVGYVAGTGIGAAKGLERVATGRNPEALKPYELPTRTPTDHPAHEALLPTALHTVERKAVGHTAKRTRAVELGENIGSFAATSAAAFMVPLMVAGHVGGPIGIVMSTIAGTLVGMLAGGVEEDSIGVGRLTGELAGNAIDLARKALHHEPSAPTAKPAPTPAPSVPHEKSGVAKAAGWAGHKVLEGMEVLAEPLVTTLLDAATLLNRLFKEKAWQTIPFQKRPEPQVDEKGLIANFKKLAGIPGVWHHEQAIGAELGRQLTAMGIPYTTNGDGVIIATVPASASAADSPTVVLSAHQDTVKPTALSAERENARKIYTDGHHVLGGDDRGGCAEILEGVRYVLDQKLDHPELKIVFTTGEEAGLRGADHLKSSDITTRPALGFVVDSTDINNVYLTNDSVIITPDSVKYNFSQEDPLIQVVFKSMADAGTPLRAIHAPIMTGAGSDANTPAFNSDNIRSLAVGAGESDIHTSFENIKKQDLIQGAKHVVGYITNATDLRVQGPDIVPR